MFPLLCNNHKTPSYPELGNILVYPPRQFKLRNIRPRDAFRPIAREQKYLMDYKLKYIVING